MKKTLVALAALAATGAFAQATISGAVAWGYMQSTTSGADASGFGIDTAELNFNASEDLGGGSKVTSLIQFDTVSRSDVKGGDVVLGYSTPSYALTLATTKGNDYLTRGIGAVGNKGLDGAITGKRTYNDFVTVAVPVASGLKVSFTHTEAANGGDAEGINAGAAGTNAEQRRNLIAVDYAVGALVANVGIGSYDQPGTTATNYKSIGRAALSYDLGFVKLGAAFDQRTLVTGTRTDTAVGVMAPVSGALSMGALWASRAHADTNDSTKDGTRSGYSLRANYALSKLTNVTFDYQNYKKAFADNANSTMAEIYLTKSF